jgi:tripartite-type tricarboxylate transporter receptor subunit TctC
VTGRSTTTYLRRLDAVRQLTILAAAFTLLAGTATAQTYPDRTITMIVPFAAGGPTDTVARLIAEPMSTALGQQVIVENVAGSGGTLAAAREARSDPDGYTLMLHHIGLASSVGLYRKLPYDPATAFAPISRVTDVPMTVVARADFPANNVAELLDRIRAEKEQITFAHGGVGAVSHLCGLLLMQALETPMTAVGYKGSGPAMTDLLGRQVDMTCDQTTNTLGHLAAGKIKGYAVAGKERLALVPDLPTLDEAGVEGFEVTAWHGLYAPKGTPEPIVDKLAAALQAALKDPKVIERFADLGTEPVPQDQATPAALDQQLQAEIVKWKPVIAAAGVYAD